MTPIPMHEMSWTEIIKDNPEWVAVIASSVFAFVTVAVIIWQVCVMIWQGKNSDRHERAQNRLLKLQFEREWLERANTQREELLALVRELFATTLGLHTGVTTGDPERLNRVETGARELDRRLAKLDVAVYSGPYNPDWFFPLKGYTEATLKITLEDENYEREYMQFPAKESVEALWAANKQFDPAQIIVDLEKAIRMTFMDFKDQWDDLIESPPNAPSHLARWYLSLKKKVGLGDFE